MRSHALGTSEAMANKRTGKMNYDNPTSQGNFDDPNHAISKKLQALYSSVQDEGIPDRFLDLLEKLDAAEAEQARVRNEADDDE